MMRQRPETTELRIAERSRLTLFGRPAFMSAGGKALSLPKRAYGLAAYLIFICPGFRCARAQAGRWLWPEEDRDAQLLNLRVTIARTQAVLRGSSQNLFKVSRREIELVPEAFECDALEYCEAVATHDLDRLTRFAALAGQVFLAGCEGGSRAFDDNLEDIRLRVRGRLLEAANAALTASMATGQALRRRQLARRVLTLDPLNRAALKVVQRTQSGSPVPARGARALRRPAISVVAFHDRSESTKPFVAELSAEIWRQGVSDILLNIHDDRSERARRAEPSFELAAVSSARGDRVTLTLADEATSRCLWAKSVRVGRRLDAAEVASIAAELALAAGSVWAERAAAHGARRDAAQWRLSAADRLVNAGGLDLMRRGRTLLRGFESDRASMARAYAILSRSFWFEWVVRSGHDAALLDQASELASRAVEVCPTEPDSYRELAATAMFRGEFERSIEILDQATSVAPSDPGLRVLMIDALAAYGDAERAVALAAEIDPADVADPVFFACAASSAYYVTGRYAEVIATMDAAGRPAAGFRLMAAAYAQTDEIAAARDMARRVRTANPGFRADDWAQKAPMRRREMLEHFVDGLKRAGL